MTQNASDVEIANQGFAAFRQDLNDVLEDITTLHSGDSAPSTTYANQFWYETDTNKLYIRNEDNDAWIELLTLDQVNDTLSTLGADTLKADTIDETTSGSGVTVDGLLIKDKNIGTTSTPVENIETKAVNGGQIGGRRNIVVNGGMQCWQRSTSETGLGASSGYFTADRWQIDSNTAGRVTMAQETSDTPNGFGTALKISTTTADTSVAAGEYFVLQTKFEGQNLQNLAKGTSDAKEITVSFYVKGNAAATYMCELQDIDNAEVSSQQFSVTTSWTRVSVTFPADTSGAFDNDANNSLEIKLWLHAGSTFTSGTYSPDTWYSNGTFADRAAGISSIMDSTSRTLTITGVQMEAGSVASEFEHRSYGEELSLCQRYYYEVKNTGIPMFMRGDGVLYRDAYFHFPTTMRTSPTVTGTQSGGTGSLLTPYPSPRQFWGRVTTANDTTTVFIDDDVLFDAEL